MGNRTSLSIGGCGAFEANNCLPVTWLALFDAQDLRVETRQDAPEEEEYEVALYQTSTAAALERVGRVIAGLRGKTPAWAFLRPLEILSDELEHCRSDESVELDVTGLWAVDEPFTRTLSQAASRFTQMLNAFTGDGQTDLAALNQLANALSLGDSFSVDDLTAEERMFLLIGTYWGDERREALYSLDYFGDAYWHAGS